MLLSQAEGCQENRAWNLSQKCNKENLEALFSCRPELISVYLIFIKNTIEIFSVYKVIVNIFSSLCANLKQNQQVIEKI